jgi:hypothetical protein
MRPKLESNHGARPSNLWLFNADTHITDWLENLDVDYDIVTDEDLHKEGEALLSQYQTVMTATHPEYYSKEMWDAIHSYTRNGGRLMYLGGNGFYWRIAFNKTIPGIIETRRAEGGSRAWEPPTGEYYHAFTENTAECGVARATVGPTRLLELDSLLRALTSRRRIDVPMAPRTRASLLRSKALRTTYSEISGSLAEVPLGWKLIDTIRVLGLRLML